MKKIQHYIIHHKKVSSVLAIVIIVAGYGVYKWLSPSTTAPQYIIGTVGRSSISSTISGSGQVAALSQIDIKSKASGDVTAVQVTNGLLVKAGTLLVSLDARDAAINLEAARIALAKLTKPADTVTLVQAENALKDAQDSQAKATDDLAKSYDSGVTTVASTFIDLPDVLSGLNNMLNGGSGYLSDVAHRFDGVATQYRNQATRSHSAATLSYEALRTAYNGVSHRSPTSTIERIINDTYTTTKLLSESLKDAKSAADYIRDQQTDKNQVDIVNAQADLTSWIGKINGHLNDLASIRNSIQSAQDTLGGSSRTIDEKTQSLTKLNDGTDPLDIASQQLNVRQKEYAYQDSFIRAPFDGVVAKLNVKVTDAVSSGQSVLTFITTQKIANISLNEVDAAKIALGQKVSLTFDAIDGLTLQGVVSDVDLVGTVTQGVVTYNVKISFDSEDTRIKPGMSVSAVITTQEKSDVLVVPNTAIKTKGKLTYVEMLDQSIPATYSNRNGQGGRNRTASSTASSTTATTIPTTVTGTPIAGVTSSVPPLQRAVTVGITDDIRTEILTGLTEGEKIVTRIITTTTKTTTQAPSILSAARPSGSATAGSGASNRFPR